MTNLETNEFYFLNIKQCVSLKPVEKKKLLGRHSKDISFADLYDEIFLLRP